MRTSNAFSVPFFSVIPTSRRGLQNPDMCRLGIRFGAVGEFGFSRLVVQNILGELSRGDTGSVGLENGDATNLRL